MKKQFLLFCFILTIISCKDNVTTPDKFPKIKEIKHTKLFIEQEPIFIGGKMLYFSSDSSLVIQNFDADSLLLILNLKNKNITSYIPLGNGPNEFTRIDISQKISDSTFLFQDTNSAQLYEMNIITGEIKKGYGFEDSRYLEVVKMKDNYIATGIFDEGMFAIRNNKDSVYYLHKYPNDKIDDSKTQAKALAYQGKLLANESNERFIFCSTQFSYFEIFQYNENTINSIKKSYIGEYDYVVSPDHSSRVFAHPYENNREGYIDAYITDKRIYLLYSGRSIGDTNITTHEKASLANIILVYDWDGNPLVQYVSDVDLERICVNISENIIYAISYNPDPEIVFFEL